MTTDTPQITPTRGARIRSLLGARTNPPFGSFANLTKTGEKPGGSAEGGMYIDTHGNQWLVKSYPDGGQADNEVLASKLYEAVGLSVPEMYVAKARPGTFYNSDRVVVSRWITKPIAKLNQYNISRAAAAQTGFAADAWLANWDVVGPGFSNMVVDRRTGGAIRVDLGGALLYRARGQLKGKVFGTTVIEWNTLRDRIHPSVNAIFGSMTDTHLVRSAVPVLNLSDETIRSIVQKFGGTGPEFKGLSEKLIARREDIRSRVNVLRHRRRGIRA